MYVKLSEPELWSVHLYLSERVNDFETAQC
jgi:hypothetical protein